MSMTCTLTKKGILRDNDNKPISVMNCWEHYIKLEKGVTWDSVMLCIINSKDEFKYLTASITKGYDAHLIAEEWLELKGKIPKGAKIEEISYLNMGFVVDIYDGTKPYTLEIVPLFTGIIESEGVLEEFNLSTISPAKLTGIPVVIDKSIKFYDPKNFNTAELYKIDMRTREFFSGILSELCFYGDPFEKEIMKIDFERLIRNIAVRAQAFPGAQDF
jgi:hypothetical protein